MPISTDTTRFSIDFSYEFESPDGQKFNYPMKFLHTVIGPTVQIDLGENGTLELPADLFTETSNFLIQQGVMRGVVHAPKLPQKVANNAPMVKNRLINPAIPVRGNPLVPYEPVSSLQTIQDQPPPVDIDPEEIVKTRIEAKARASAARRANKTGIKPKHEQVEE